MKTLHFSIQIDAPREKVWESMLGDKTYREWTATFMPGSHFVGSWDKNSKIQFLSTDENGKLGGMTSMIADNIPQKFISIKHLGLVNDGVEDTTSDAAKEWVGFEKYSFNDKDGKTEIVVALDTKEDFADYMNEAWPKALQKLKEIAER